MKRRMLALLLAVFMVTTASQVALAAEIVLSVESAENFENAKDAELNFVAENTSETALEGYFVTGLYESGTDRLLTYNYVKMQMQPGAKQHYGSLLQMPTEGLFYAKTFVWDTLVAPKTLSNLLTVKGNKEPVESLTFASGDLHLSVGAEQVLQVVVKPESRQGDPLIWKSSDPTVIKVNDGVLTALAEGSATVEVRTPDGGKTATCIVEVVKKTAPILTEVTKAIRETGAYVYAQNNAPTIGSIGGEWSVFSLARGGIEVPASYYDDYYERVVAHVAQESQKEKRRFSDKVTEVERIALALAAIGKEPSNVGGVDLYDYIWNKGANFPNIKPSGELGARQGANELIFALLALDAKGTAEPQGATATRQWIIDKLLADYQCDGGGFALSKAFGLDVDITAMALQSLAPYRDQPSVALAIENALDVLSQMQNDDGSFQSSYGDSSESIGQVVVALSALGIDAHTDERFVEQKGTPVTALLSYYVDGGGFKHAKSESGPNAMATDQGLYALVAYERYAKGALALYDMRDVESSNQETQLEATLAIEKRIIGKGDTLSRVSIGFNEGDTVWDVFERELTARNIPFEHMYYGTYDSVYIQSIDGDGEFDHGSGSGWMFHVNGEFPNVGVSKVPVKQGDAITFVYVQEYNDSTLSLADVVTRYVRIAKTDYLASDYTPESYSRLAQAIQSAEVLVANPAYQGKEIDDVKGLELSDAIATILAAQEALVVKTPYVPTPAVVPDDFQNDLWLNTNFQILGVGETYQLVSRRVPEIIDGPISNSITHPPYRYRLVSGDSVSLEETTASQMTVTAVKTGTSVVEVSYDAVEANGKMYGACSPVNKSYFVVDVQEMPDVPLTLSTDIALRSYDTVYFSQGETTPYTFTVTSDAPFEVTVNGQTQPTNGSQVTVQLENRSNIVGIRTASQALYYVLDARKIEVAVENETSPGQPLRAGDTAHIAFKGITMPVYKLATIYNPTWYAPNGQWGSTYGTTVRYTNPDLGELISYDNVQYELAEHNAIRVTLPESKTYTLAEGHIDCEWWGSPLGTERDMSGPGEPNLNADVLRDKFSVMPSIQLVVDAQPTVAEEKVDLESNVLETPETQEALEAPEVPEAPETLEVPEGAETK